MGIKKSKKVYQNPIKTGQIIEYRVGDDGTYENGYTGGLIDNSGRWDGKIRFRDNGDGTITDRLTKLMWTKNTNQGPGKVVWNTGIDGAVASVVGGYTDWRLPNVRELFSLVDFGNNTPALISNHPFENVLSNCYWTSTTVISGDIAAYKVDFTVGLIKIKIKTDTWYVWYCRTEY